MIIKEKKDQQLTLAGKPKKPLDVFGFVNRYGPLIIAGGLVLLFLFVPLIVIISKPNYETSAKLQIVPVVQSLINAADDPEITGYYDEYVRSLAQRISSYEILSEAYERLKPEEQSALLPQGVSNNVRIAILQKILHVYPITRTHFVELSISGSNNIGLAPILNTVMDIYLEKMREEVKLKNKLRMDYLVKTKQQLTDEIAKREQKLNDISRVVHSSTFAENFNVWQKKLVQMLNSSVKVFSDRVVAENELKYQQKAAQELTKISLNPLIEEAVLDDRAIGFTSSWTYQELQKMRGSIDGVTADNKDRQRVEQRMSAMRDYENRLRKETRDKLSSIYIGKRQLQLEEELIRKENHFLETKKNEQELNESIQQLMVKSGENSAKMLEARALEVEIKHSREMLFRLDNRIHDLTTESKAPLRVSVETRARIPELPTGSNMKKLLIVCFVISFGSVGGFFLFIEYFDNRIRSPKNIIHALGHPPSWPISKAPPGAPFECVLNQAPTSPCSKALRSLANKLLREHEDNKSQVFLFTAVDHKSGTTGILANTAKALAYYSPKVLVIDGILPAFDSAKAQQQSPEGENDNINSLDTEQFFRDSIKHYPQAGIDALRSFFPNKPDSYNSRLFREILSIARREYDFICVDSSPVMKSDFTEHLVVNSDVAILIAQGDSTLYRDLRLTAEILIRMEISAIAPVLNWGGVRNEPWFEKYLAKVPGILKGFGFRPPAPKPKVKEETRSDQKSDPVKNK